MPCYHPLPAYKPHSGGAVLFNSIPDSTYIEIPCGQCIGCKLERSRVWAIRCLHESQLHSDNCFITLTFSDEFLPRDGSLDIRTWQLFMKKFRKKVSPHKLRFFMCGEYGEALSRPHYHACIFGYDFSDKILWAERDGVKLFISKTLQELWPYGFATIGDVTFESAAYIARYCTKKITGSLATSHYAKFSEETGEISHYLHPEFNSMSRRPGIASGWFDKFGSDLDKDFIVVRGVKIRPPKFYDRKQLPEVLDEHKLDRFSKSLDFLHDNLPERLLVREQIQLKRFNLLNRGIEQ